MDSKFVSKVKWRDAFARRTITLGGISIIASMLVMIIFMIKVVLPLFVSPKHTLTNSFKFDVPSQDIAFFGLDPYLENGFITSVDGTFLVFDLETGSIKTETTLENPAEGAKILRMNQHSKTSYTLFWNDGSITLEEIEFHTEFDQESKRSIVNKNENLLMLEPLKTMVPGSPAVLKAMGEGNWRLAFVGKDGAITYLHHTETEDFLGEKTEATHETRLQAPPQGRFTTLAMDLPGSFLFAGTDTGSLLAFDTSNPEKPELLTQTTAFQGRAITQMRLAFGDVTLVVSDDMGQLAAFNVLPGNPRNFVKIHDLPAHKGKLVELGNSYKDKGLLSLDEKGVFHLSHLTSERLLLNIELPSPITQFSYAERGDGLLAKDSKGEFWLYKLEVPHPEISFSTLWSKVWYEGYQEPVYAWQSSSASDDFEPKMSLVPLLFGSLKGTFYGMMFSLPLALFGAIYVSHLMSPRWRSIVKPTVELMAAIPSVVTGFLAALWLAPKLESNLLAVVFALVLVPSLVGGCLYWLFVKRRKITGKEFLWSLPMILVGVYLSYQLGLVVQNTAFGGNLNLWLFQAWGLDVDQRNCVVIGFALGFAVIPIIFTISEDALYNVPKHLSAAALALGSSRWQTVRRVVLPMATPGIFAACMIGFGRAVGETMIVLMATGNTPIMSPSILNGMRTLSANIAVEIPEAPVDSTLYRILFLSALLLFAMTFVVNTAAEVVRVRLKRKYKNL